MGNKVGQYLNIDKFGQYILVWFLLVGAIVTFFYWQSNALSVYDSPGHVSLTWYIKNFLWPKAAGWNPFFLVGWPQGVFYPSLFHWISATLGFLFGVENAIKLVVSGAIFATPFAAYYAAKNTIYDRKYWLLVTFLILIFLVILPNFLGIGFRGLFQIGLIPNFVATALFLLFIGLLHGQFVKGKYLLPALVLAALVLTHLVASIAAGLYFIIYLKVSWLSFRKEAKFKPVLWLVLITAATTAFFWVPFLLNFSLTSTSVHLSSYFTINIVLALVVAALVWFSYQTKLRGSLVLSAFSLFLIILALIDSFLIRSGSQSVLSDLLYPLHIYRFQPYAYLALILAFGAVFPKISLPVNERVWKIGSIVLFLILLAVLLARNPTVSGANFSIEGSVKADGRFIETFRRTESSPLLYAAQTKRVLDDPEKNQWAYGLFTDSTPNGPYLGSLIRSLRPEAYQEGEGRFIETRILSEKNVQSALDLFGIKYLLNLGETRAGEKIGSWNFGNRKEVYSAYKVGEGKLAEVMNLTPVPVESGFDEKILEWWDQKREWSTLPFEIESETRLSDGQSEFDNLKTYNLQPKTAVQIVGHNKDWTNLKLNIDSETPQPVLIKFSYFPWWSASAAGSDSSSGQDIKIYRAAPNQMLIFANGEVELEYKEPIWLMALYLISLITFLVLIRYLLLKR